MGDVHPHSLKALLARELSRVTFERWTTPQRRSAPIAGSGRLIGKVLFCNSGFEAVEAALKTAFLATHKPGIVAFKGGYHGLGYGALNATHRAHFRGPFLQQLAEFGHFVTFPTCVAEVDLAEKAIRGLLRSKDIGAILAEPIQVRGGINVPPPEFLLMLRAVADEHSAVLVLDEIYTGFGRTGAWFGCEHTGIVPDIICLGKALTGGFPLSACVGRARLMDEAWPVSNGEAIHTSTFLGNPVGCAMALAQIEEIRQRRLPERSRRLGQQLLAQLSELTPGPGMGLSVRGQGLLAGIQLHRSDGLPASAESLLIIQRMLHRGYILLPEGEHADVISFTPPLTISARQLNETVKCLAEELRGLSAGMGPGSRTI